MELKSNPTQLVQSRMPNPPSHRSSPIGKDSIYYGEERVNGGLVDPCIGLRSSGGLVDPCIGLRSRVSLLNFQFRRFVGHSPTVILSITNVYICQDVPTP